MADSLTHLQDLLLQERERYNSLFALARRSRPNLDPMMFELHLSEILAPLLVRFEVNKKKALDALYPLLLDLSGAELFERSKAVTTLWMEILPVCATFLQADPARAIACLTNAVYNLENEPGADWEFWLKQLADCRAQCGNLDDWLGAAQVLAWISGMAHYRESAIARSESLSSDLLSALVPRWDRVVEDPWWPRRRPEQELILVHRVGGFVGFGGYFKRPPEVLAAENERFWVSDGLEDWLLFSDGFGATLKRARDLELSDPEPSNATVSLDGEVCWDGWNFQVPEVGPVSGSAVSGQLLAVTGSLTHQVSIYLRNFPAS